MSSVKTFDRRGTATSTKNVTATNDMGALAETRLRRNGHIATQDISCNFHEGVLTLRGCVPSYYLKQIAQTVVMQLDGVEQVDNRIEVTYRPSGREVTGHDQ